MFDTLKKVPLFADLPDEDLQRLSKGVEEVELDPGQELFAEGDEGNQAYVICDGELEVVKASVGREVLLAVRHAGEVIGEMAVLEDKPRMASVRALTSATVVGIKKVEFDNLLSTSPTATSAMFHAILSRWHETESLLRQSEKMAQLGTLTAGVAHELNNPAAAVRRGSDQLQMCLEQAFLSQEALDRHDLHSDELAALNELGDKAKLLARQPSQLDALARSDREAVIESWLEAQGFAESWELSPTLVKLDLQEADLDRIAENVEQRALKDMIAWLDAKYDMYELLYEIGQGSGRISEIVKALKSYSYLDQAPVQKVNIHEGLEDTLVILKSKIPSGVKIERDYADDLPEIQAYGSELNQVWTNLIDNAIDAVGDEGTIILRSRAERDEVVVEVEDDGPGIPEEIQSKVFDSFFTTKEPGKGTGLGLDISYNIVVQKHRGDIKLHTTPGDTRFEVRLPINFEER